MEHSHTTSNNCTRPPATNKPPVQAISILKQLSQAMPPLLVFLHQCCNYLSNLAVLFAFVSALFGYSKVVKKISGGIVSVAKILLRSGCLDDFQAVGDHGQLVFDSALQIRETLRLRQQAILHCLAIPQRNDQGDYVDWYAPVTGKVLSWATADDVQRTAALQKLETALHSARMLCDQCQQSTKTAVQLFGSLLEKALQFPGHNHVYLVDNQPVITFWGFITINQSASPADDPFACLRQYNSGQNSHNVAVTVSQQLTDADAPLLPVTQPLSPVAQQLHDAYVITMEQQDSEADEDAEDTVIHSPDADKNTLSENGIDKNSLNRNITSCRRRQFGWLSVVILLLVTLAGGFFWWQQPPAPAVSTKKATMDNAVVTDKTTTAELATTTANNTTTASPASSALTATSEPAPMQTSTSATYAEKIVSEPPLVIQPPAQMAEAQPAAAEEAPPSVASSETTLPPQLAGRKFLVMNAIQVRDGLTRFMDGNWQINLINNGELLPEKIRYKIWRNSGNASVTLPGNITCRVSLLSGLQASGALMIKPRGRASCTNSTRYTLPDITCKLAKNPHSGEADPAQCTGYYSDDRQINVLISQAPSMKKSSPHPRNTDNQVADSATVNKEQR